MVGRGWEIEDENERIWEYENRFWKTDKEERNRSWLSLSLSLCVLCVSVSFSVSVCVYVRMYNVFLSISICN